MTTFWLFSYTRISLRNVGLLALFKVPSSQLTFEYGEVISLPTLCGDRVHETSRIIGIRQTDYCIQQRQPEPAKCKQTSLSND